MGLLVKVLPRQPRSRWRQCLVACTACACLLLLACAHAQLRASAGRQQRARSVQGRLLKGASEEHTAGAGAG